MDVVIRTPTDEAEVTIDGPGAETTLGDLLDRVTGGPVPTVAFIDGRAVPTSTPIEMAGLLNGAVIDVDPRDDGPVAVATELVTVAGNGAGLARRLPSGRYRVGPGHERGIEELVSGSVEQPRVELLVGATGHCTVRSPDGHLDGVPVAGTVAWRSGTLTVDDRAFELRRPDAAASGRRVLAQGADGTAAFNRPPRASPAAAPDLLVVPDGGRSVGSPRRFPVLAMLAPLPVAVGMAMLIGNWRYLLFGLLSPVMLLANYVEDRRSRRHERRQATRADAAAAAEFRGALDVRWADEIVRRRAAHPNLAELVRRAVTTDPLLWERRGNHDDAFVLPLGLADVPWSPPLERRAGAITQADAILAERAVLPAVPVVVDLQHERGLGIVGDGPDARGAARAVVLAAAALHGPADLDIVVCADPRRAMAWDWVKWLPHAPARGRVHVLTSATDAAAWADAVAAGHERPRRPTRPNRITIVVADGAEWWRDRAAPLRAVLADPTMPVRLVAVGADVSALPAVCTTYVELGPGGRAVVQRLVAREQIADVVANSASVETALAVARALAPLDDPELTVAADTALPAQVSILDVLGIDEPTIEAVTRRWARSSALRPPSTPVGLGHQGPFVVDLVADGPHGLVAGTTGAGKSELLRTLVVGLASSLPPDELNLVLIDFKGGSAFDACAELPHTVGLVTDLDEHLAGRVLRCLRAELGRRERLLRQAGLASLDEQRGLDGPLLPRLVIIVDEFAALAVEFPDFMPALVDIAQRGRSLGLHLILATQRPAGVVDNKIKANTNLRIALRVQDDGDSIDVIGTRDAAAIPRSIPGRAVARLGAGELVPFQSALATGARGRRVANGFAVRPFLLVRPPTAIERRVAAIEQRPQRNDGPGTVTDLRRLVGAMRDVATRLGQADPRRPYLEPLPAELPLLELLADHPADDDSAGGVPFALVDLPDEQRQVPRWWHPGPDGSMIVYGGPGSGSSTLLATLAISAASRWSPDDLHLYVIDADANSLAPLDALPHTGAVARLDDGERLARVVRHLADEVDRRRRLALDLGGPQLVVAAQPTIVLLVDNVGALRQFLEDDRDLAGVWGDIEMIIRDGRSLGICVVLTATQERAVPGTVAAQVGTRLVLRLADRVAYAGFGFRPADLPDFVPGRALCPTDHTELQVARPPEPLSSAVAGVATDITRTAVRPPRRIDALPARVALDPLLAGARRSGDRLHLPIGLDLRDATAVSLMLDVGTTAFVGGPSRSGRSTALAVIATACHRADPALSLYAVSPRHGPLDDVRILVVRATDPSDVAGWVDVVVNASGSRVVFVDDADRLAGPSFDRLAAATATDDAITLVVAGRADALRSVTHWTRPLQSSGTGVLLRPAPLDGELLRVQLPARVPRFDAGRGYLVHDGELKVVMMAHPAGGA